MSDEQVRIYAGKYFISTILNGEKGHDRREKERIYREIKKLLTYRIIFATLIFTIVTVIITLLILFRTL
jgi:hypothetical protein